MKRFFAWLGDKLGARENVALAHGASLLLVVSGTLWAYFTLRHATTPLILHFSSASGIDRIGGPADLLRIGGMGTLMMLVNAAIGLVLAARERFLAWLVALATLFLAVLLFIFFAGIISVN